MRLLLIALVAVSLGWTGILGCGITTHLEVAYRAVEFFKTKYDDDVDYKALILKHQDAFQASTSYPDSFYADVCEKGKFHQVSEDTHWTPFIEAAVGYIRETYPKPWNEKAEKLVVFLLGIVSHDVADISWHNLGLRDGFLSMMGKVNFKGSYGNAHSHGDFGGDVINQVSVDTEHISTLFDWYIPSDDLQNIYKRYYGDERMKKSTIDWCTKLMYLGRFGENLGAINVAYPSKSYKSPFLLDSLQDYYLGGMDDMSAWTTFVWDQTIHMLKQGTNVCHKNKNPMKISCSNKRSLSRRSEMGPHEPVGFHHPETLGTFIGDLDPNDLESWEEDGAIHIKASTKLQLQVEEAVYEIQEQEALKANVTGITFGLFSKSKSASANYITKTPYARLGESLQVGDFNGDGFEDLAVGAPLHSEDGSYMDGRVLVIYGTKDGLPDGDFDIESKAGNVLSAPKPHSRFGKALATVDLNADGVDDLAVSAPSQGSEELRYQGAVYVYFGQKNGQLSATPDVTIGCHLSQCTLGWSLLGHDVTKDGFADLIIGAPFTSYSYGTKGMVGAIFAKPQITSGTSLTATRNFDWKAEGRLYYSWFGFSLSAGGNYLAIGAPQAVKCEDTTCSKQNRDIQAAGQVSIYSLPLPQSKARYTILGWQNFAQLGYDVALSPDGNTLAVGAVSENQGSWLGKNQEGRVYLYDLRSGDVNEPAVTLPGDSMLSRYGSKLQITDINKDGKYDVVASAPLKGDAVTQLWGGAQEGRVHIFYGKDMNKPGVGIKGSKAGNSDELLKQGNGRSRFGTDFAVLRHSGKVSIAISSVHSNTGGRLAGKVSIFKF